MSIFSSVGGAFKSIFKGVGKVFHTVVAGAKSFISSNIGKAVLVGAAIYLGGAAMGAWKTGFDSIDGSLASTNWGSSSGTGVSTGESAATPSVADTAASTATGGMTDTTKGVGLGGQSADQVSRANATPYSPPAPVQTGGFMSTMGKVGDTVGGAVSGAAKWMAANPIPTLVGGQMLASAFSPNNLDVIDKQEQVRINEENRRKQDIADANARISGVGAIPTFQYSGAVPQPPQPPGIMARRPV